jgi:hypothetical protein
MPSPKKNYFFLAFLVAFAFFFAAIGVGFRLVTFLIG